MCILWKFCPFTSKQPTSDTIYYLEYVHLLKFLVDRRLSRLGSRIENEADKIHRKYEEHLNIKQEKETKMRQQEKRMNEIILLFYPRLL